MGAGEGVFEQGCTAAVLLVGCSPGTDLLCGILEIMFLKCMS